MKLQTGVLGQMERARGLSLTSSRDRVIVIVSHMGRMQVLCNPQTLKSPPVPRSLRKKVFFLRK